MKYERLVMICAMVVAVVTLRQPLPVVPDYVVQTTDCSSTGLKCVEEHHAGHEPNILELCMPLFDQGLKTVYVSPGLDGHTTCTDKALPVISYPRNSSGQRDDWHGTCYAHNLEELDADACLKILQHPS